MAETPNRPNLEMDIARSGRRRRLPIYLLLDCSGSMRGAPISAVQVGVEQFLSDVRDDLLASETVCVGVVLFGDDAELVTGGLVPVERFAPPKLKADGRTTCLGKALTLLEQSLTRDVRAFVPGGPPADYKPIAFILTDGEPTDNDVWPGVRQRLMAMVSSRKLSVITVGCGPGIDENNMQAISMGDTCYFNTDDMQRSFKMFFEWVTKSVVRYSATITETGSEHGFTMADTPSESFQYVAR